MIRLSGVSGETSRSRRNDTTPDEVPARIDHVQVEDNFDVARTLKGRDRFPGGHVLGEGEDLRVHDAARRLLLVFEQVADVAAGRAPLQQLEDGR